MLVYLYTLLLQARSIRGTREACIYHFFLQQKYLSYINIINRINNEFVPTFFSEHVKNEVYVISKRILLPPPLPHNNLGFSWFGIFSLFFLTCQCFWDESAPDPNLHFQKRSPVLVLCKYLMYAIMYRHVAKGGGNHFS